MIRSILLLCVVVAGLAQSVRAQDRSIGARLGNPMGVYYKQYFQSGKAFEFGIGSASPGWNTTYYENSFDKKKAYDGYLYRSHRVESTFYMQGRYLMHYNIPVQGMEGKLEWYWGAGAMLKLAKVRYRYINAVTPEGEYADDRVDIDFGPEGIAGMEYTFEDVPVTLFGEISLLLELADRPGAIRTFGGTGARYRF